MFRTFVPAVLVALAACTGGGSGEETAHTADTGWKDGNDYMPYCDQVPTDVALDEVTELGFAAQTLVDFAASPAPATFTWSDDTSTELSVSVTFADTARFVDEVAVYPEPPNGTAVPSIGVVCEDHVAIDADLVIQTADGRLDETLSLTFVGRSADQLEAYVPMDPDVLGGSLVFDDFVSEPEYDARTMNLSITFDATGHRGTLDGSIQGGDDCDPGEVCAQWAEVVTFGTWGQEE